ncbi:MAG TPA: YggT family protein [Peptococcaceae bacterium]|nr:YggT family protein [Peptococcaceae bacterium]
MYILYQVIRISFSILQWLIIARVVLSWVNVDYNNPLVRFIYEFTEPILAPFRRLIPRGSVPLDFSPLFALIFLQLLENFILRIILGTFF